MAFFNYQKKEIDAKIVYYGPGISGKTTNLQYIHQHLKPEQRGKMVSLATDEERTLFFDFLPIELESVRGFRTHFHLYTVPGQVYYGATRRAVLTGADGIIFVADSQRDRLEDNLISIKDLEENLHYYGRKIETVPLIIQYNKRDLPNVMSLEELNSKINRLNVPHFESVAILGKGVFETLTMMCRMVLKTIEDGTETRKTSPQPSLAVQEPAEAASQKGHPRWQHAIPSSSWTPLGRKQRGETEPDVCRWPHPGSQKSQGQWGLRNSAWEAAHMAGNRLASLQVPKLGQVVTRKLRRTKRNGKVSSAHVRSEVESLEKVEEKQNRPRTRQRSCASPRASSSANGCRSVEIPKHQLKLDGRKRLAVNLKVAVNLDQLPTQGS
jgi:signal recognition particle receptor subunit beta